MHERQWRGDDRSRARSREEAIDRRALEIMERRRCNWVEAWARALAEQRRIDGQGDVDVEPRAPSRRRIGPPGRVALSAQIGHPKRPRPGTGAPGRRMRSAALPATVMRSAERAEIDPDAAELVTRARRGGAPLDDVLRPQLEAALGAHLDGVRVHTGADADAAARALGARAFAIGDDVFFRDGAYDPHRRDGQRLIAHEVAHTVQACGGTAPTGGPTRVSQPDDAPEREAEAFAEAFILGVHGLAPRSPTDAAPTSLPDARSTAAQRPAPTRLHTVARHGLFRDRADATPTALAAAPAPTRATAPTAGVPPAPPTAPAASVPPAPAARPELAALSVAPATTPAPPATAATAPNALAAGSAPPVTGPAPVPGHTPPTPSAHAPALSAHAPTPSLAQKPPAPARSHAATKAGGASSSIPGSPLLAAAGERIRAAATSRKQAIGGSFAARHTEIASQVAAKVAHIRADGTREAHALLADLTAREQEVRARFTTTRAGITEKSAAQKAKAHTDESAALAELTRTIADKRRAATQAAEIEATGTEGDGRRQAQRADTAVNHAHTSIDAASSSAESSVNSSDDDVRSAVRSELSRTKGEIKEGVRAKGHEATQGATESAREAARGIRDGGRHLAEAVGGKATDLEKSIRDGTVEVIKQIEEQAHLILTRLADSEHRATAGWAQARSQIQPALAQATTDATGRVQQVGDHAAADLDLGSAAVLARIDEGAEASLAQLASVSSEQEVSPEDLQGFEGQVVAQLDAMCTGVEGGLAEQTGTITGGLDRAGAGFSEVLRTKLAGVRDQIATAVGETHALTEAPASFDAACTTIHGQVKQSRRQGLTQYAGELDRKISDARTSYVEQRTRHNEQISA